MKYAYYPGCLAESSARELDQSMVSVARVLGLDLHRLESVTCCGAGEVNEAEPDLLRALNARTLALAEQQGLDILTVCNVCTLTLRTLNQELQTNPHLLARANQGLSSVGLAYKGSVEVTHLLWVLVRDFGIQRLASLVKSPLTGLRVAPFYGCQILRPSARLGFDDPLRPQSLEAIIRVLGGEPVDYEGKSKCCAFLTSLANQRTSLRILAGPLLECKEQGANCMVTPCPMCHLALDTYQTMVERETGAKITLPILHLPQLIGLALGLSTEELGVKRHAVPMRAVLASIDRQGNTRLASQT
jgi:succinate dehydrogenase / fumarate reductase cytochrome b subunit